VRSLRLDSPVSPRHVLNFGALFILMEVVGTIRRGTSANLDFLR
jgi:hypothetical protein